MDIGQQVQAAPTEAARVSLCLRDEEANGSARAAYRGQSAPSRDSPVRLYAVLPN